MKNASTALKNFVANAPPNWARADFYTITLNGGGILRYCSMPFGPVLANGFNFGGPTTPIVEDAGVKVSRGVVVATVDITFFADERHVVGGVQFLDFVENLGFDGALIKIERGFAPDMATMRSSGPVGTYIRFNGKFSEAKELGQTEVVITASSPLDLFTNNSPEDCYQTPCKNALFDARCTLNPASFVASGTVAVSPTPTVNTFGSGLTPTANDYALGKVVFTSGANDGLARTIKSNDGSGNFVIVVALPVPPAHGDTFQIYPGCDLSMARCTSRFNNLIHFRGEPFIPPPATGIAT